MTQETSRIDATSDVPPPELHALLSRVMRTVPTIEALSTWTSADRDAAAEWAANELREEPEPWRMPKRLLHAIEEEWDRAGSDLSRVEGDIRDLRVTLARLERTARALINYRQQLQKRIEAVEQRRTP